MTDAEAGRDEARTRCPLCGHGFTDEELAACHAGCPMAGSCSVVKCPNCGTEFPKPGAVTRWLGRLLSAKGGSRG